MKKLRKICLIALIGTLSFSFMPLLFAPPIKWKAPRSKPTYNTGLSPAAYGYAASKQVNRSDSLDEDSKEIWIGIIIVGVIIASIVQACSGKKE